MSLQPHRQYCLECRDLDQVVTADFILWGKLFPSEALGPRCYDHTTQWVRNMSRIEQWAVYDLRPVNAHLAMTAGGGSR